MTKTDAANEVRKFPPLGALRGTAPRDEEEKFEDMEMMHAPDPVGHFMLIALPALNDRTEGGIYIPDVVSDRERAAAVVGAVMAMGPDCYTDPPPKVPEGIDPGTPITLIVSRPRFPGGPWCKVGDTVLFSRYAGKRFTIGGVEFRMLADDEITATIPEGAKVGGL